MTLEPDTLWRRIGHDGMPPLAKTIFRDGRPIARIVDVTDYLDLSPEESHLQPETVYSVEWRKMSGWREDERRFSSFDEAFAAISALDA